MKFNILGTLNVVTAIAALTVMLSVQQVHADGGGGIDPIDPTPISYYCDYGTISHCPSGCSKDQMWTQTFACCYTMKVQNNNNGFAHQGCCIADCLKYPCSGAGCPYVIDTVLQGPDENAHCSNNECVPNT
ncbi:MAG: hypothetical protein J0H02_13805 [Armatimonadetes bacterium]|nr:hypothetical protein [Armatimonadota bacterium]